MKLKDMVSIAIACLCLLSSVHSSPINKYKGYLPILTKAQVIQIAERIVARREKNPKGATYQIERTPNNVWGIAVELKHDLNSPERTIFLDKHGKLIRYLYGD